MWPVPSVAQARLSMLTRQAVADADRLDAGAVWERIAALGGVELVLPREKGGLGLGECEICLMAEELGAAVCDARLFQGTFLAVEAWSVAERDPVAADVLRTGPGVLPGPGTGAPGVLRSFDRLFGCTSGKDVLRFERAKIGSPSVVLCVRGREYEWHVQDSAVECLLIRARLRWAAFLLGVGRLANELARVRASSRMLGGRPLIARQATAHAIARCAINLELARVQIWRAAWEADRGEPSSVTTTAAIISVLDAAVAAARRCVQVHGAAGTSHENVQWAYRAAHEVAAGLGPAERLWREALDRQQAPRQSWQEARARPAA